MPTTNLAYTLGPTNTGWDGTGIPGLNDPPPSLDVINGNYTHNSATPLEGVYVTGELKIAHSDAKLNRVRANLLTVNDGVMNTMAVACEFGNPNGQDANSASGGRNEMVRGVDLMMYRCKVYGAADHFRPRAGDHGVVECFLFGPYQTPDGHQNPDGSREPSHCDAFQPLATAFNSLTVQDTHYAIWPYNSGTAQNSFGVYLPKPATSGIMNAEYAVNKNITVRGFFLDGNYSQIAYIINGDNDPTNLPPPGAVFIDGIIRKRQNRQYYGASAGWNFGYAASAGGPPAATVTYGRIYDYDTGAAIPPNYQGGTNAAQIITAGPSSNYAYIDPTIFYDSNPPPPPPPPPPGGNEVWLTDAQRDALVAAWAASLSGSAAAIDAYANIRADLASRAVIPA
jgi:hypothetical protein